jgi:hypothetical protein
MYEVLLHPDAQKVYLTISTKRKGIEEAIAHHSTVHFHLFSVTELSVAKQVRM